MKNNKLGDLLTKIRMNNCMLLYSEYNRNAYNICVNCYQTGMHHSYTMMCPTKNNYYSNPSGFCFKTIWSAAQKGHPTTK